MIERSPPVVKDNLDNITHSWHEWSLAIVPSEFILWGYYCIVSQLSGNGTRLVLQLEGNRLLWIKQCQLLRNSRPFPIAWQIYQRRQCPGWMKYRLPFPLSPEVTITKSISVFIDILPNYSSFICVVTGPFASHEKNVNRALPTTTRGVAIAESRGGPLGLLRRIWSQMRHGRIIGWNGHYGGRDEG